MRTRRTRMLPWLMVLIPIVARAADPVSDLAALRPMRKVHYWRPADYQRISASLDAFRLIAQVTRLTRTFNVQGEWTTLEEARVAVALCRSNDATIGIWWSPLHRGFASGVADPSPFDFGPSHDAELTLFAQRLQLIRDWIVAENRAQSASVTVSAILLDSERFTAREPGSAWNAAIDAQYDAFYWRAKHYFPSARVEWYGRGIVPNASETGYGPYAWNTFTNRADSLSTSLYRVQDLTEMREAYRRTVAIAGALPVTPWIALGSGYQRRLDRYQEFVNDWRYDRIAAWMLGAEINIAWYGARPERFAPWNRAEVAVLWPGPLDALRPSWTEYFLIYCRGANDVKILDTDGP